MDPGLYLVGTPIGHLDDLSQRALATLRDADVILAEDTRHTRKLLSRYDLHTPLVSCHRFNEASRVGGILERIGRGEAVALVTDSGMPGVSDPGSRVAAACREHGCPVTAVPGPSAVTTAVALSGLGGSGFYFAGFLAHKSGARRRRLEALREVADPLVLFESPYRLLKLLGEVEEVLGPRRLFVARELTKRFEETVAGTPAEVRSVFEGRTVKGEVVVVVAGAEPPRGRIDTHGGG